MANSTVLLTARRTHTEGRKKFLHATMVDTSNGTLLADATALFVSPRTA